ncbi:MAG: hypothetical protein IJV52_06345 [Prevotella sp.]|nr:hypothetical protein [Prevotella sp.]
MKKIFTFAAALFAAMAVNAQTPEYVVKIDQAPTANSLEESDNVTLLWGDNCGKGKETKDAAIVALGYEAFIADGGNPTVDETDNITPTSGSYQVFKAKNAGTLIVCISLNANKEMFIVKGTLDGDLFTGKTRMSDTEMAAVVTNTEGAHPTFQTNNDGNKDVEHSSADKYVGFVTLPVAAGDAYAIFCKGSKLGFAGYQFVAGDPTGIANVAAAKAENARMFNLVGQEVSKNFKGIVVVNGKKFMNK